VRAQEQNVGSLTQDPQGNFGARGKSFGQASFGYILLAPALIIILGLNLYPTISASSPHLRTNLCSILSTGRLSALQTFKSCLEIQSFASLLFTRWC
jgi:hypothetical protein